MNGLLDNLALALATLRSNPLRSLLTLLGIVIGTATVVAMMSFTEGLRLKVTNDLTFLGAGAFQVQKFPPMTLGGIDWARYAKRRDLTRAQGEALKGLCPHVAHVSVEAYHVPPEKLSTRDRSTRPNVWIAGGVPDFEPANGLRVAAGRFLNDLDVRLGRRVIFVGSDVADLLFPGEDPVGREVRVRAAPFRVIGVAERMGSMLGLDSKDSFAVMPYTAFDLVLGRISSQTFVVQAATPEEAPLALEEVTTQLRRLRGLRGSEENDFEIFTNDSITRTFNEIAAVVSAATFGVCALALLVGGIGIMNIMLVSVTERTREIGIRKALGARRRRILAQFMFEALALSLLGGLLGVLLGAGVAVGARELYEVPASVPGWAVLLSLLSASGAGLAFGVYPAARASRLDPVEAMRTE